VLLAKLAVEVFQGPDPPGLDVSKPLLNCLQSLFTLFIGSVLILPETKSFIQREARASVG